MSRASRARLAGGLLLLGLSACASTPHPGFDAQAIRPPAGMAAVVLYRENAFAGSAIEWRVTEGIHPVATITAGQYCPLYVKSGTVDLYAFPYLASTGGPGGGDVGAALTLVGDVVRDAQNRNAEGRKAFSVNAKANAIYYLKWEPVPFSGYPRVTEVSSAVAAEEMRGLHPQ